jgi:hypothetical protein
MRTATATVIAAVALAVTAGPAAAGLTHEQKMSAAAGVPVICVPEHEWPADDIHLAHAILPGDDTGYPAPSVTIRDSVCRPMARVYQRATRNIGFRPGGGWYALARETARINCTLNTGPCPEPHGKPPGPDLMAQTDENLAEWRYSQVALRRYTTLLYRAGVDPKRYRMKVRFEFERVWLCPNVPPPPGYDRPPTCPPWHPWQLAYTP